MKYILVGAYEGGYNRHNRLVDVLRDLKDKDLILPFMIYDHKGVIELYFREHFSISMIGLGESIEGTVIQGYKMSDGDVVQLALYTDATELNGNSKQFRRTDSFMDIAEDRDNGWYNGKNQLYKPLIESNIQAKLQISSIFQNLGDGEISDEVREALYQVDVLIYKEEQKREAETSKMLEKLYKEAKDDSTSR